MRFSLLWSPRVLNTEQSAAPSYGTRRLVDQQPVQSQKELIQYQANEPKHPMNTTIGPVTTTGRGQDLEGKFLTFILGNEAYAIPVLKVREIIRLTNITSVPQMPDWIRGVINLRGKIIPVMDLRRRFGFTGPAVKSKHNCIVVLQTLAIALRDAPGGEGFGRDY